MAIKITGVTPLLQVYDMRRSVAFYREMLGFEVVQSYEPEGHLYWAMLRLGGAVVMLNAKYEDDERPSAAEAASNQDVELYFDCDDVDAAYMLLRRRGCEVAEPVITHYGMKQMRVRDPDGFGLCFQQPAGEGFDVQSKA